MIVRVLVFQKDMTVSRSVYSILEIERKMSLFYFVLFYDWVNIPNLKSSHQALKQSLVSFCVFSSTEERGVRKTENKKGTIKNFLRKILSSFLGSDYW